MGNSVSCSAIGRINDIYRHRERSSIVPKFILTKKNRERRGITNKNIQSRVDTKLFYEKIEVNEAKSKNTRNAVGKNTGRERLIHRDTKFRNSRKEEGENKRTNEEEEKKEEIYCTNRSKNTNCGILNVDLLFCKCRPYFAKRRMRRRIQKQNTPGDERNNINYSDCGNNIIVIQDPTKTVEVEAKAHTTSPLAQCSTYGKKIRHDEMQNRTHQSAYLQYTDEPMQQRVAQRDGEPQVTEGVVEPQEGRGGVEPQEGQGGMEPQEGRGGRNLKKD